MDELIHLSAFSVIGKLGSTQDGPDFINGLIKSANENFEEISSLVLKKADGSLKGVWGLMSGNLGKLEPWGNNFTEGQYLYGAECGDYAKAPEGWARWNVPARSYFVKITTIENYKKDFYDYVNYYIPVQGYKLIGAAFDREDPNNEKNISIYFPVAPDPIKLVKDDQTLKISPCGLHCGYCFFKAYKGCLSNDNCCSFARMQKDQVCPNVRCSKGKGLKGCYECNDLEKCDYGFYALPGYAKSSAIFIKKHGKKALEEVIQNLLGKPIPYYQTIIDQGDYKAQLKFLEKNLRLVIKAADE